MFSDHWLILSILTVGAILSCLAKKLTAAAAITGWLIGLLVFAGAGYCGIGMMATFFLLGTLATSVGMHKKQQLELAEKDKGKRTTGQVIANAGAPSILGLLAWLFPEKSELLQLMLAASFASATADTLSSELGNLYGSKFFNVITFKKDKRGLDGVISAEGTLAGVAGSVVIASIFAFSVGWSISFTIIVIAGTWDPLESTCRHASLSIL